MPSETFNEAFRSVANGHNQSATNPLVTSHNENESNDAHGTLLLSKEGRSKYLGPTAGSEWLKDVRRLLLFIGILYSRCVLLV